MLLVMDVGNSNTVVGLYDDKTLRAHWRVMTTYRTSDELYLLLASLLEHDGFNPKFINACCIASVVPQVNHALQQCMRNDFHIAPIMVGPGVRTGLVLHVENPKEVGADRIVNIVAALDEHSGPLIVIDFGTATTFDAVTAKAEYNGGVIIPGIQLCADALAERCAKLPSIEISRPDSVIGRDTITHIRSGLTYGYADMVDGLISRMADEMKSTPKVIATGGLAGIIADIAKRIDCIDPWLTLKGLKAVYHRNEKA